MTAVTATYIGNAVAINHVDSITVAGTYATGDTITITGLSKTVVLTVGSLVTNAQIATSLMQAWNSSTFTDTTATVAPVKGGRGIPEFSELLASISVASSAVILLTGTTAGKPMPTFTVSKSSTSGTIAISHTTAATGPNDWNNTANWDTGLVPVTGDSVILDRPIPILYGLAQSAVTLAAMTITARFDSSCQIGLLSRNPLGYEEWRATELAIGITALSITSGSGLIKINFGSVQTATTVYSTGSSVDSGRSACQLRGTHASNTLTVLSLSATSSSGDVGWGSNGETATVATVRQDAGNVTVGANVTLTTVTKNGGTIQLYCAGTTFNNSGDAYMWSGAWTTVTSYGGTIYDFGTSTFTTMTLNNSAVYNSDGNVASKTITTLNMNDASQVVDTAGRLVFTNAIARKGRITVSAA